jgi:hypothetical protein
MVCVVRDPRSPPQGGLPPSDGLGGAVEIACDESGFSGTNLLDASTPVFTHASVDLPWEEAAELICALRSGLRWSLHEFKSGQLLRSPRAGAGVQWFLGALTRRAHVHVIDKEYFLVTRVVDLLLEEPSYAAGTRLTQEHRPAALALYRAGRASGRDWELFLAAFIELVRSKRRRQPDRSVADRFFQARDSLAAGLGAEAGDVLCGLSRSRVWSVMTRLAHDDRSIPPPLEPLLPALAETVLHWSGGQRRVLVVHDEQSALTAGRLRLLQRVLTEGTDPLAAGGHHVGAPQAPVSPLAGLVTVDSRDDPRVQVADLLAGLARRSSHVDDDGPLQPFLSPTSLRPPELWRKGPHG